jgi:hypothetical protein
MYLGKVTPAPDEITLDEGWDSKGSCNINEVTDKELVEYCTLWEKTYTLYGHVKFIKANSCRSKGKEERIIIIYYSWNGGRAEAVCAGGKGVRMR